MSINLVLLYGGKSGEHEVSLRSAASVLQHLDVNRYHVTPVGIAKDGSLFVNQYEDLRSYLEALPVSTTHSQPLKSLILDGQFALKADVVFPVIHGPLYEDGALQGLLDMAGVPYVGCGVLSSSIGMDKDIARRLMSVDNIAATTYEILGSHIKGEALTAFCAQAVEKLRLPIFVKPCVMGSSVGIHKVTALSELEAAVADARQYDDTIIMEAFVKGREIEVAVLENLSNPTAPITSVLGEIRVFHPDGFYSYAAKYLQSEETELIIDPVMDNSLKQEVQRQAALIFSRLKCSGMARVDFFVDDEKGEIYFSEINTLPGFTTISMYPKLLQASGYTYAQLLESLIEIALVRGNAKKKLKTDF